MNEKKYEKFHEYRMTNAGQTNKVFGEVITKEDQYKNLWITFKKGHFQVWINPEMKIFTLIKGGNNGN